MAFALVLGRTLRFQGNQASSMRQYLSDHWLGDTKRRCRASLLRLRKHGLLGRPERLLLGGSWTPGVTLGAKHRSF